MTTENTAHYTGFEDSNHNMSLIEGFLDSTGIITSAKNGILMSLVYTAAARYLTAWVTLNDSHQTSDDQNINESAMNRNNERLLQNEQNLQEAADIMAWAQAQLPENMVIDPNELTGFFMKSEMSRKDLTVESRQMFAELMGITEEAAENIYNLSTLEFAKKVKAQKEALVAHKAAVTVDISTILNSTVHEFEIGEQFAARIIAKMCDKLDDYAGRRDLWAAQAVARGQMRKIPELAAEKKLLKSLVEEGNLLLQRYETAA